eukprot:3666617-Lingulodinium_polyedra.AAC.1
MAMARARGEGSAGGKLEALLASLSDSARTAAELEAPAAAPLGRGDPTPLCADRIKFAVGKEAFDP